MTVTQIRDALKRACEHVYHYRSDPNITDGYAVWGETNSSNTLYADDENRLLVIHGEIYYYTKREYDSVVNRICEELNNEKIGFSIANIGYDDSLNQIVYQFDWEVVCGYNQIYE